MGGGVVIAAAAAARRRRKQEVVDAFRLGDATSVDRARPMEALGIAHVGEADQMIREGVLMPGRADGTYYLNEAMYIAIRERRDVPRRIVVVLAIILLVVGLALTVVLTGGQ